MRNSQLATAIYEFMYYITLWMVRLIGKTWQVLHFPPYSLLCFGKLDELSTSAWICEWNDKNGEVGCKMKMQEQNVLRFGSNLCWGFKKCRLQPPERKGYDSHSHFSVFTLHRRWIQIHRFIINIICKFWHGYVPRARVGKCKLRNPVPSALVRTLVAACGRGRCASVYFHLVYCLVFVWWCDGTAIKVAVAFTKYQNQRQCVAWINLFTLHIILPHFTL